MSGSVGVTKIPLVSTFDATGANQAKAALKELQQAGGGGAPGGEAGEEARLRPPAVPRKRPMQTKPTKSLSGRGRQTRSIPIRIAKLDDLHKRGAISTDTYRRAQKQAADMLPKSAGMMQRLGVGQAGQAVADQFGMGGITSAMGSVGRSCRRGRRGSGNLRTDAESGTAIHRLAPQRQGTGRVRRILRQAGKGGTQRGPEHRRSGRHSGQGARQSRSSRYRRYRPIDLSQFARTEPKRDPGGNVRPRKTHPSPQTAEPDQRPEGRGLRRRGSGQRRHGCRRQARRPVRCQRRHQPPGQQDGHGPVEFRRQHGRRVGRHPHGAVPPGCRGRGRRQAQGGSGRRRA